MKPSVFIDKGREEEVIIYAHEKTDLIDDIEKLISQDDFQSLIGYSDYVSRRNLKNVKERLGL